MRLQLLCLLCVLIWHSPGSAADAPIGDEGAARLQWFGPGADAAQTVRLAVGDDQLDTAVVYPRLSTSPWHERLPDVEIPLIDGTTFRLSDARGKVLLLDFWATWCEPCIRELPVLQALYQAEHENGLEMVAVNYWEPVEQARSFAEALGLTMPLGFMTRPLDNALPVPSLPTVILIDRSGVVRNGWSGGELEVLKDLGLKVYSLLIDEPEELIDVASVIEGDGVVDLLWVRPAGRKLQGLGVFPLEDGGAQVVSVMRDLLVFFNADGSINHDLRLRTSMSMMWPCQLGEGRRGLIGFRPGSRDITVLDPEAGTLDTWQAPSAVFDLIVVDNKEDDLTVGSMLFLATLDGLWQSRPGGEQPERIGDFSEVSALGRIGHDGVPAIVLLEAGSGVSELDASHEVVARHEAPADAWVLVSDPQVDGRYGVSSKDVVSWVSGDFLDGPTVQLALVTRSEQLILVDMPSGRVRFRAHWEGISSVAAGDLDGDGRLELAVRSDTHLSVLRGRVANSP